MIDIMRPVLSFLKNLAKEKEHRENNDDTSLEDAIKCAKLIEHKAVEPGKMFISPQPVRVPLGPPMDSILYKKPNDEIKRVMKLLNVSTNKAVGEKTFEYYMECEGDE